ncbi:unnamed protein product, partial [Mycena citricolor]
SFSFQAGYEHPTSTHLTTTQTRPQVPQSPSGKGSPRLATLVIKAKGDAMVQRRAATAISPRNLASTRMRSVGRFLHPIPASPTRPSFLGDLPCVPRVGWKRAGAFYISVLLDMGESHQARKRAKTKPSSQTLPINHKGLPTLSALKTASGGASVRRLY